MKKKIVLIIMPIILICIIFFAIDFYRAKNNQSPIFTITVTRYRDGGSGVGYGIGYKVCVYSALDGKILGVDIGFYDIEFDSEKSDKLKEEYGEFKEEYQIEDEEANKINSLEVTGFEIVSNITITNNEAQEIVNLLEKLKYDQEICLGINKYTIKLENGTTYYIKSDCNGVAKNGKQAEISNEEIEIIENIIKNNI